MKHVVMSNAFAFSTEPFPAYRAEFSFGRNQNARAFLPVAGVIPVTHYVVTEGAFGSDKVFYEGPDQVLANAACEEHAKLQAEKAATMDSDPRFLPKARVTESFPTLPEGQFKVIKTKEKGTVMVVGGQDSTDRCLLFVGCVGGFRGGVSLLQAATSGNVLKETQASNACESRIETIVVLEVGQLVAFYSHGRRTNEVYTYTWNGTEVERKHYSKAEWDTRNVVATILLDEDVEVL